MSTKSLIKTNTTQTVHSQGLYHGNSAISLTTLQLLATTGVKQTVRLSYIFHYLTQPS